MRSIRRIAVAVPLVAALLLVALMPVLTAGAQGGLSEEELALVERVYEARGLRDTYASYVTTGQGNEYQRFLISYQDATREMIDVTIWERTMTVIQAPVRNVDAAITATVESSNMLSDGRGSAFQYGVSADARLVDEVVYLNAVVVDGALPEDLMPLPVGWFVVDDPESSDVYDAIQLGDLPDDSEDDEGLFKDKELLIASALSVTIESTTLDDGAPVDVITVLFDRVGLLAIMRESEAAPLVLGMIEYAEESTGASLAITLDAEDNPLRVENSMVIEASGVDAHALSPDEFPEGMTFDFAFDFSSSEVYDQVNAAPEPAAAPEISAEETPATG